MTTSAYPLAKHLMTAAEQACPALEGTQARHAQLRLLNSCNLHKVPLQAALEIAVPVDRH